MTDDDRHPSSRPQHGGFAPDDLPTVAARLTEALQAQAGAITPHDRLESILAEAHGDAADSAFAHRSRSRWAWSAAAAAAIAIVAGTVWVGSRPDPDPGRGAAASSAPSVTTPPASGTPSSGPATPTPRTPTGTSTDTPTSVPGAVLQAVPVYYVGPRLVTGGEAALFREFVRASVTTPTTPEARARAAVSLAMAGSPAGSSYERLWAGVTLVGVDVGEADRITIRLSGPATVAPGDATLAVQQLVWTAQAAAGQGNVPVRFVLEDGSATVAGDLPASDDYVRPTDEVEVAGLLAPLWVDNPARGQVLPAGSAITVKGQASTFEATLSWQLLRSATGETGETVVHDGFATASAGAPARGEFTFTLPPLAAGSYTIRVFEVSMQDGSDRSEQRIPFSVR
jgi:hypothetical protein